VLRRFEHERPQAKSPAFWLNHLLGGLHFLLGRGDRSDEERAGALVGRLEDVPRLLGRRAHRTGRAGTGIRRDGAADQRRRAAVGARDRQRHPGRTPRTGRRLAGSGRASGGGDDGVRERSGAVARDGCGEFALGEEDFDFHLHYEHALRDTAPELWRYGLHLKEEVEADLARRAARLDGGQRWQDVADRLRADHPPPPGWWKRTPGRWCGPATSWRSAGSRRSPTPRSTSCPRRPSCDR